MGLYGLEFAHGVRVDAEDNVWVVDEGTNMVIKFNPEGRVVMVLGRRPEPVAGAFDSTLPPAPAEKYRFGRPTDVTWDPQGNIFVSDGYVNSRVVKYDKNGRFVKSVGTARGSQPSQLNTPHSITSDAQGNIYVGDRGNARVQVFDNDLTLRAIYDNVGNPWAVCVSPGPHQYLFVSNSNPDSNPAASWAITGEIYKMELDGTIVGKFGKAGKGLGEFSTVHDIDCRNPNELFVVGDFGLARAEDPPEFSAAAADGRAIGGRYEDNSSSRCSQRPRFVAGGAVAAFRAALGSRAAVRLATRIC